MTSLGDDLLALMATQRAHRSFTDEPVPDELLTALLRAATFAPNSENRQPWVFVAVRDNDKRVQLGELMHQIWVEAGREYTEGRVSDAVFKDVDQGMTGGLAAAPVLLLVGGDAKRVARRFLGSSIYPAVQNILLGATAFGMASVMTTITSMRAEEARAIVGLPEHIEPMAVIPLGWPAKKLGPPKREPVESKLFFDTYEERSA